MIIGKRREDIYFFYKFTPSKVSHNLISLFYLFVRQHFFVTEKIYFTLPYRITKNDIISKVYSLFTWAFHPLQLKFKSGFLLCGTAISSV